ncbi:MAG: CHASE2 domain-containing sensor protein [bacterium]|jgi:CHASE2 domain-containing sensor protein
METRQINLKNNNVMKNKIAHKFLHKRNLFILSLFLTIVYCLIQSTVFVKDWENRFQANYYLLRTQFQQTIPPKIPVVIVLIDDASIPKGMARSPLNRTWISSVIKKIAAYQPSVIGVNILFDRYGTKKGDEQLKNVIQQTKNIVLRDDAQFPLLSLFSSKSLDSGSLQFRLDSSGVVQEVCSDSTTCKTKQFFHQAIWKHYLSTQKIKKDTQLPNRNWLKINFLTLPSTLQNAVIYPVIKAHELNKLSKDALKGKIVLLGTGFSDLYQTYRLPNSNSLTMVQEVEVLAHVLGMMANQNFFKTLPNLVVGGILLLILIFFSWIVVHRSPIFSFVVFPFFLVGYFLITSSAFAFWNIEIPFLVPSIFISLFLLGATITQSVQEKIQRLTVELQLKQSKIDLLTNELHSHHLFNEFSRISVMIRQNAEAAREYLIEFSEMLRLSLKYSDKPLVPFREQVDYLKSYIYQQQIIHQKKLDVHLEVDDNALIHKFPWHSIFPLVENAVKYSEMLLQKKLLSEVKIEISIKIENNSFVCLVENPFSSELKPASAKKGVQNLENRLGMLYPNFQLELAPKSETQWLTKLTLPLNLENQKKS